MVASWALLLGDGYWLRFHSEIGAVSLEAGW